MAVTKSKKKETLKKLEEVAKNPSIVFVKFHGLPMAETNEFRKTLKTQGVNYFVSKKTLAKKAFSETGVSGEMPVLDGELGIAFSNDAISPAREIFKFQKKWENKVSILGGVFEKEFKAKDFMVSLAEIPDELTLRGMFVNVINSPIQGFVLALNAIAEKKGAVAN